MGNTMSRGFGILVTVYFVAVVVGIGGLQMHRVNAGMLTDYGADLLAPPYLYVMFRSFRRLRLSSLTTLAVLLGGCFLWEWLQRYDLAGTPLGITHGTFDPFDLLAYIVGLLAIYVVDVRWSHPRRTLPSSRAD